MASAPQPQLPLFYKDLLPLNSRDHADWKAGTLESAAYIAETHAIPVTSDEFVDAQRNFPIVFTAGENPLPIALFILLALVADQAIKQLVEATLPMEQAVHVIPMLALYRTYNYGVAFSMLSGMEGWFIVGMRLVVVGFVLWQARRSAATASTAVSASWALEEARALVAFFSLTSASSAVFTPVLAAFFAVMRFLERDARMKGGRRQRHICADAQMRATALVEPSIIAQAMESVKNGARSRGVRRRPAVLTLIWGGVG